MINAFGNLHNLEISTIILPIDLSIITFDFFTLCQSPGQEFSLISCKMYTKQILRSCIWNGGLW